MRGRCLAALAFTGALLPAATLHAAPVPLDRAVVRFVTRETGGAASPRFVFERELAFEARLEALVEGGADAGEPAFRTRHVRTALERHVTETVLASRDVDPRPSPAEVTQRAEEARIALAERVGGFAVLGEAARAEGITEPEVLRLARRQALASLYLDRMVAPMLEPTDAELRAVHRAERTPFAGRPYDQIRASLRRWYVSAQIGQAVSAYYEGLRSRIVLSVLR